MTPSSSNLEATPTTPHTATTPHTPPSTAFPRGHMVDTPSTPRSSPWITTRPRSSRRSSSNITSSSSSSSSSRNFPMVPTDRTHSLSKVDSLCSSSEPPSLIVLLSAVVTSLPAWIRAAFLLSRTYVVCVFHLLLLGLSTIPVLLSSQQQAFEPRQYYQQQQVQPFQQPQYNPNRQHFNNPNPNSWGAQ